MKYSVFVSSTTKDLYNERIAAEQGILAAQCQPVMFERTFTAQDTNSMEVCMGELATADIYLLILGECYGWEHGGKSITELEYQRAVALEKPRLVFTLPYLRNREQKQQEFAERVGKFDDGRFWKSVNNAFELKDAIEAALRLLVEKLNRNRQERRETVLSNLLPVRFPVRLHAARVKYDRQTVLQQSREAGTWKLRSDAGEATVAARALALAAGDTFKEKHFDFVVKGGVLYTFSDLSYLANPYRTIVDLGSHEELAVADIATDPDGENLVKHLLKNSLRHKLAGQNVAYMGGREDIFYFGGKLVMADVAITWGEKNSKRDVISTIWSKEKMVDGQKVSPHIICFRHFAMHVSFSRFGESWYACVNPTYVCTSNGYRKSRFSEHYVTGKKSFEDNSAFYQNLRCWAWYLSPSYPSFAPYPHLRFESALDFDDLPLLNDQLWLPAKKGEAEKTGTLMLDF